jgi:hypothetical protein
VKSALQKALCQNEAKFLRTWSNHEPGIFCDVLEAYPLSSITDGGEGLGRGGVYALNPQLKILSTTLSPSQSDPVKPISITWIRDCYMKMRKRTQAFRVIFQVQIFINEKLVKIALQKALCKNEPKKKTKLVASMDASWRELTFITQIFWISFIRFTLKAKN